MQARTTLVFTQVGTPACAPAGGSLPGVSSTAASPTTLGAATPSSSNERRSATAAAAVRWVAICQVDDIPPLGARRVHRDGAVDVAVFRGSGDRIFALLDRCPHKGGPLSQGIVFGDQVACPLHNWTIGLSDGQAQAPDQGCTPRFRAKVEDGIVWLDADELDARS